jgi:TatD DNase family protein
VLIDSHAHIQDEAFAKDIAQVMERARSAGVEEMICVGFDYLSSCQAVEMARQWPGVYAVVGIHPHDARECTPETLAQLFKLAADPRVVAVGEIGLDFYRDLSPREQQRQAFIEQIQMARELKKPVVIHDRDAHQEVLEIIKKEKAGRNGGIMHCYSGHLPLAQQLIKEGFHISLAGPLTYKNANKTREVAARVPLDRLLVETDCPYLSPEPLRGKRNEPAHVKYVAEMLAQIRQKPLEEIAYLTARNTRNAFNI